MRCELRKYRTASVLELQALARFLVLWVLGAALFPLLANAQSRPVLLNAKREYLAGRLVLVPADTRFESFPLPRQLAQITDHELRTPPRSLYEPDQRGALNEWARTFDFAESDGLIASLDQLEAATLREIRARHPHLLIYGFSNQTAAQSLLNDRTLNFFLVDASRNAAILLLARWINQRFGYTPAIAPIFSAESGRALLTMAARSTAALGGQAVSLSKDSPNSDLRLYVHTPQTSAEQRALLVKAITANVTGGMRIALVDATDKADERAELLRLLREAKLLDRLTAFASVNPQAPDTAAACQRALVQASLWLSSLRFLRDDTERFRRTERAQIAALLNSYLREAIYPALTIEAADTQQAREANANAALRPQAETLFSEQFKRNVHALLLNTGERVEFELRQLQRVQVRLDEPDSMPEIRTDVYLVLLGTYLATPGLPRAGWEFDIDSFDTPLGRRFDAIPWQTFKTDQPSVMLSLKLNKAAAANQQGYSINSRRAGETRRIQINAASAQGAFYALAHLEHLGASEQLAQDFQFTETPVVTERGFYEANSARWSHRDRLGMLKLAGRARLNTFVYSSTDGAAPLTIEQTARWRELLQTAQANFVTLVYAFEVSEEASENDFVKLTARLRMLHRLGVEKFLIQPAKSDNNNTALTQRLQQWMQTQLPDAQLLSNTRWQWLPCATAPLNAWTLPQPLVNSTGVMACVNDTPRVAQLPLALLGAFTWSGKALNPVTARAMTLNWLYGEKARAGLAPWLAAFAQPALVSALNNLFDETATEINVPLLKETLAQLAATLPQFDATREQGLLRGELLAFLLRWQQRLEQIQNDTRYERTESGTYRRKL